VDERETDGEQVPEDKKPGSLMSMGVLIGISAGSGLVFGMLLGNLALGIAFGAGLGVVAGAQVEANRKRK
jgi:hypothetical protein